jgi:hypothetical protein
MRQPYPPHSKIILATSLSRFNSRRLSLFVAILSRGGRDSKNFAVKYNFYKNLSIPTHQNLNILPPWNLKTPGQHGTVMVRQGKGGGHMHIPAMPVLGKQVSGSGRCRVGLQPMAHDRQDLIRYPVSIIRSYLQLNEIVDKC